MRINANGTSARLTARYDGMDVGAKVKVMWQGSEDLGPARAVECERLSGRTCRGVFIIHFQGHSPTRRLRKEPG